MRRSNTDKIKQLMIDAQFTFSAGAERIYEEELYAFVESIIKECAAINWYSHIPNGESHAQEVLKYFEIEIE
jgi:hypothetical protein